MNIIYLYIHLYMLDTLISLDFHPYFNQQKLIITIDKRLYAVYCDKNNQLCAVKFTGKKSLA